jgi:hypothetical protein
LLRRVQIAGRREALSEPRLRASRELGPGGDATHERRPLRQPDRERRHELFAFGVHEHHLDVVLEQHLPQPEAFVHPRTT